MRRVLAALCAAAGCGGAPAGLDVPPGTRLVVVAPHPDDETLGCGGLVQRVRAGGGTARIVVVTAGDGFREAAAGLSGHAEPTPGDYRALGAARATELGAAARILGVDDLVLLHGPDGGLAALTTTHWSPATPYVSPTSGRGPFAGAALYEQLRGALARARPTLVAAPDPQDFHADHAATGRLAAWAVAALPEAPRLLTYLVHDAAWPPPHPADDRLPPPARPDATWVSLELTPAERATKRAALRAHRSQWAPLGGLLARFLRRNEVFAAAP